MNYIRCKIEKSDITSSTRGRWSGNILSFILAKTISMMALLLIKLPGIATVMLSFAWLVIIFNSSNILAVVNISDAVLVAFELSRSENSRYRHVASKCKYTSKLKRINSYKSVPIQSIFTVQYMKTLNF